ncbi:MAG: sulfurtransferase [Variovorax sp.]
MTDVLNIAAYKFVPIADALSLRADLREQALQLELKGTVLLASEGINLFLAGAPVSVERFIAVLLADARFADLPIKRSHSHVQPFRRLLVKVKREIIRMDQPTVQPDALRDDGRAPAIDPPTLKRWLDQGHDDTGRPLALLDARNAFEVDLGSFDGAIDWRLERFSQFPQALAEGQSSLADKTVVSFCTGGIRCEKAALWMRANGVEHALQLDGGILAYFEQCGGAHWHGDCFVFDGRGALAPDLTPRSADASAWAAVDPDLGSKS